MENNQLASEQLLMWTCLFFGFACLSGIGYFFIEILQKHFRDNAKSSRLKFIRNYQFSEGFQSKFSKKKHLLKPEEREKVLTALKDYFYVCNQAGQKMVSMPSQIVDDAWHEFILFTREYQEFCDRAFGYFLHHIPAEAMAGSNNNNQEGIKRAWRLACTKENIQPEKPDRLPLLFAIDSVLEIENGFYYELDCLANKKRAQNQNNYYCVTNIGCAADCGGTISSISNNSSPSNDCSLTDSGSSCGSSCGTDSGSSCSSCGSSCGGGCGGGCGGR